VIHGHISIAAFRHTVVERIAADVTRRSNPVPGISVIIYPVNDLARAKALFGSLLGVEAYVDQAYYVGFKVGQKGMSGPVPYFDVDEMTSSLQRLLDAGAQVQQAVKDVGGGKLTAIVKDADGNIIGLVQAP
jgi:predicted enzyme related to lactoylglutathione lyase